MNEVLVAHPEGPVRKGQTHGFDHDVQRVLRSKAEPLILVTHGEPLEHLKHLDDGEAARGRRWHRRDGVTAVMSNDGLPDFHVVRSQIGQRYLP